MPKKPKKKRRRPSPRLLIYGITAEQWTARYGLEPFTHPCHGCGALLTTSIPFRQGTIVGLTAPKCECGEHDMPDDPEARISLPPYAIMRDPKYGDLLDDNDGYLGG